MKNKNIKNNCIGLIGEKITDIETLTDLQSELSYNHDKTIIHFENYKLHIKLFERDIEIRKNGNIANNQLIELIGKRIIEIDEEDEDCLLVFKLEDYYEFAIKKTKKCKQEGIEYEKVRGLEIEYIDKS